LLLVAVAGLWFGQLDATGAGVIAGFAFVALGLGHKAQKYADLLIAQTDALKKTGHIDTEVSDQRRGERSSRSRDATSERRIFD
jgi:hypothetical protein